MLALALAPALLLPATARAADPRFSATVSPDRVVFGETAELEYRVQVTTGEDPERFEIDATGGSAFDGQGSLLFPSGGQPRLEGPGTLSLGVSYHGDVFPCSRSALPTRHGTLISTQLFELDLPARSTSTLVFAATPSQAAPWPGDRFELLLTARNPFRVGTLDRALPIPVASPVPAGREGVRLELVTEPSSSGSACGKVGVLRDGPVTIRGTSDPPLGGQTVLPHYVPPGRLDPVALARVPVAADGTFSYRGWRPRRAGRYELAAAYTAQRPGRADDFSVPRVFDLVVSPRIVSRRVRVDADGIGALTLACPVGTRRSCQGLLRLTRGRRASPDAGSPSRQARDARCTSGSTS